MRSKYLISYSIDNITNLIGYDSEIERDGAFRQYTEIGIITAYGTQHRPDYICAHDTLACAGYRVEPQYVQ
jgi:hypothetical protein